MITGLCEFRFGQKINSAGTNERSDFYEPWQQHKQLETETVDA